MSYEDIVHQVMLNALEDELEKIASKRQQREKVSAAIRLTSEQAKALKEGYQKTLKNKPLGTFNVNPPGGKPARNPVRPIDRYRLRK